MKIEAKHELMISVAGQPQQQGMLVPQDKAKKGCFFKSGKEEQKVVKRT
jgi:hypothetical protein